jgi:cytochrome c oxidase subunit 2
MRRRLLLTAPLLLGLAACQDGSLTNLFGPPPQRTFPIFYAEDSSTLSENGKGIVALAVDYAKQHPQAKVEVRGFAAPDTGSARFNRAISEARARGVADAMVAAGIPASRIAVQPRGAVPFEMFPTESRRVEIHIGG